MTMGKRWWDNSTTPRRHTIAPMDMSLSDKESFYLIRLVTTERLHLEAQWTGTVEFTNKNVLVGEGVPEEHIARIVKGVNQQREDALEEIAVWEDFEKRFWRKIVD